VARSVMEKATNVPYRVWKAPAPERRRAG